jgi:hypothetical protein
MDHPVIHRQGEVLLGDERKGARMEPRVRRHKGGHGGDDAPPQEIIHKQFVGRDGGTSVRTDVVRGDRPCPVVSPRMPPVRGQTDLGNGA